MIQEKICSHDQFRGRENRCWTWRAGPASSLIILFLLLILTGCSAFSWLWPFSDETPNPMGKKVVRTARACLGVPYRYGGASPRGFDCSGLTYYVYKKNGYLLPRTAEQQMSVGHRVSRSKLRPGDLVFFKTGWFSGYHVGIYAGKDRFIHAPKKGGRVEYESLFSKYYHNKYYSARRLV